MDLFRSEEHVDRWLAGRTRGATTSVGQLCDLAHAWFVGFAPAHQPKIVVAVMVEFGDHGYTAARYATAIMAKYLGVRPPAVIEAMERPVAATPRPVADSVARRPAAL